MSYHDTRPNYISNDGLESGHLIKASDLAGSAASSKGPSRAEIDQADVDDKTIHLDVSSDNVIYGAHFGYVYALCIANAGNCRYLASASGDADIKVSSGLKGCNRHGFHMFIAMATWTKSATIIADLLGTW